jgi:hypothetical protein
LSNVCEEFGLANPLKLHNEEMYYYSMELARGSDEGWLGKGYMKAHPYDTSDVWAMYVPLLDQTNFQ